MIVLQFVDRFVPDLVLEARTGEFVVTFGAIYLVGRFVVEPFVERLLAAAGVEITLGRTIE